MNISILNSMRAALDANAEVAGYCCFTHAVYETLGWVELVESKNGKIIIHHSYPEGIDIKPYVKDIIKQMVADRVLIELEMHRIDSSQARSYRERRDDAG